MEDRNEPTPFGSSSPTDDTPETAAHDHRKEYELRARCAQLRHWCRGLFDTPGAESHLAPEVVRELREAEPEMSADAALDAIRRVALGEPLPPDFVGGGNVPRLAAERERLRTAFFTVYDAQFPDDNLTDEYFQRLADMGDSVPIADILTEIERELEAGR